MIKRTVCAWRGLGGGALNVGGTASESGGLDGRFFENAARDLQCWFNKCVSYKVAGLSGQENPNYTFKPWRKTQMATCLVWAKRLNTGSSEMFESLNILIFRRLWDSWSFWVRQTSEIFTVSRLRPLQNRILSASVLDLIELYLWILNEHIPSLGSQKLNQILLVFLRRRLFVRRQVGGQDRGTGSWATAEGALLFHRHIGGGCDGKRQIWRSLRVFLDLLGRRCDRPLRDNGTVQNNIWRH